MTDEPLTPPQIEDGCVTLDWSDFQAEWRRIHLGSTEFCDHAEGHPLAPLPERPHDEDGYCCWCGNGSWKLHAPWCEWADAMDLWPRGAESPFDD